MRLQRSAGRASGEGQRGGSFEVSGLWGWDEGQWGRDQWTWVAAGHALYPDAVGGLCCLGRPNSVPLIAGTINIATRNPGLLSAS